MIMYNEYGASVTAVVRVDREDDDKCEESII